jgi:hypothetical protein
MKRWLSKGTLVAVIAISALSGVARADDFGCSDATLKGEYAFGVTAYTPPNLPDGPPAVVAGIKVFDGKGNLTQRDYSGDALRTRNPPDRFREARARNRHLHRQSRLHGQHGDPLERAQHSLPSRPLGDQVRNQRRRPPHPRSRGRVHSAWIYHTPTHPNQRRRLEGRLGAGRMSVADAHSAGLSACHLRTRSNRILRAMMGEKKADREGTPPPCCFPQGS